MSVTISASQVKDLRERTGVGMMECKKALTETGGDMDKAILWLREHGLARAAKKADRLASEGLVEVLVSQDGTKGALVEVNCETDFVSKNEDFVKFCRELAELAVEQQTQEVEVLSSLKLKSGETVAQYLPNLIAKIGENLKIRRVIALKSPGLLVGYTHLGGKIGSLVALEGAKAKDSRELGKDLAMHIAATAPRYMKAEDVSAKELEIERDLAKKKLLADGKPEHLAEKITEGHLQKFLFKEACLLEQGFVKDPSQTIKSLVASKGVEIKSFARYQMGEGLEKKSENFAEEVAQASKAFKN